MSALLRLAVAILVVIVGLGTMPGPAQTVTDPAAVHIHTYFAPDHCEPSACEATGCGPPITHACSTAIGPVDPASAGVVARTTALEVDTYTAYGTRAISALGSRATGTTRVPGQPIDVDPVSFRGWQVAANNADDVVRLGTKDSWGNLSTLDDHFARHGADFGATSADDYARQASEFLQQPGTLTKVDPKTGVIRVYDPATDAFGAYNPSGTTRTFYVPDPAIHGYPTNLAYWNAQAG